MSGPPRRPRRTPRSRPGTARRGLIVTVTVAPRLTSSRVSAGLGPWLTRAAPRAARGHVGVALMTDQGVRALNGRYRRQPRATDVLSFPVEAAGPTRPARDRQLGDIAIALGVARRQAAEHGHSLAVELRILALHGLLHLLGYDHERDQGQMHALEERLRRRLGLPAGLVARASGPRTPR